MSKLKLAFAAAAASVLAFGVAACEQPADETTGVEETLEEAGEAVEGAAEDVGAAVDEAAGEAEEAVEEATE